MVTCHFFFIFMLILLNRTCVPNFMHILYNFHFSENAFKPSLNVCKLVMQHEFNVAPIHKGKIVTWQDRDPGLQALFHWRYRWTWLMALMRILNQSPMYSAAINKGKIFPVGLRVVHHVTADIKETVGGRLQHLADQCPAESAFFLNGRLVISTTVHFYTITIH